MRSYVYDWRMHPSAGLELEIRVEATSAAAARRQLEGFLEQHALAELRVAHVFRTRATLLGTARDEPGPGPDTPSPGSGRA